MFIIRLLAASAAASALAVSALAETPAAPPTPPPGAIPHGHKDARLATAGDYKSDTDHTAVLAIVSHIGFSHSYFRFEKAEASLHWDPVNVGRSSLTATVEVASISTPVKDFAKDLSTNYLKAGEHPQASFVSTRFTQTDATHGKVAGNLTLMGRTVPVVFDVTLIGAGPFFGQERIGLHAVTHVDPKAVGLPDVFDEPIEISVDTEFFKGEMKLS